MTAPMLPLLRHALVHYPAHKIAVRTHPAAADKSLILKAAQDSARRSWPRRA